MIRQKKKAWGGRFSKESHPLMETFNASLSFDQRLYREDIEGSLAHAKMLNKISILSTDELQKIEKGLKEIKSEIEKEAFPWSDDQEDIHMAIEARLVSKIGPAGAKLHTARSRNDQVATDLRLYCKKKIQELIKTVGSCQKAFLTLATTKGFAPLPGYTHLQRAQPIYWAHHLLAYFEMLERDQSRLADTLKRCDVSPLGSGALAGSAIPIDREFTAKALGFSGVTRNSLDAVSDRDFAAELLFDISLIMMHLSRFAEELVLWSSQEFGFVKLPQEFCTGSSMMPQKVNPDAPELIRGKSGRVYGNLFSLLTVLKGLPLSYNKDLQEDKEPLFDSLDTVFISLSVLTEMIPLIEVNAGKMKEATRKGFLLATDLAEYLVTKGVEFRRAHEIVGKMVQDCIKKDRVLEEWSVSDMKKFAPEFSEDVKKWLDIEVSINRRNSVGGTAKTRIKEELERAKKILKM